MLDLSRVTRAKLSREEIDLSALVRSVGTELQKAEPQRQVEFTVAEELFAEGDPRLLRIVLENLLRNAWKFTGKHPRAKIEFGVMRNNGEPAYFVRDDGAGFDMTYANKLFGAFQRLHAMTEFNGTGVGLATVQRIINRHGGRVWAQGEVEKGATFYFTL
jgi:light-regulated signal transduction histidine kinase (bacteriophytochrome)